MKTYIYYKKIFKNIFTIHTNTESYINSVNVSCERVNNLFDKLQLEYTPLSDTRLQQFQHEESRLRIDNQILNNYSRDTFSIKRLDICVIIAFLLIPLVALLAIYTSVWPFYSLYLIVLFIGNYYSRKEESKIREYYYTSSILAQIEEGKIMQLEKVPVNINSLDSVLTCIHLLARHELIEINDTKINNIKYEVNYNIKLNQTQFTFLFAHIIKSEKIKLVDRKQTEISKLISTHFCYKVTDKDKAKEINQIAFFKEINRSLNMEDTSFKKKYNDFKYDLRYLYDVFKLHP